MSYRANKVRCVKILCSIFFPSRHTTYTQWKVTQHSIEYDLTVKHGKVDVYLLKKLKQVIYARRWKEICTILLVYSELV